MEVFRRRRSEKHDGSGEEEECKVRGTGVRAERLSMKRRGGSRNPVDEVTYMPGVIRRLWLLCDFDPRSPSNILPAIYSATLYNNRSMSSTCDWAARRVKTRISPGLTAASSTSPVRLQTG